MISGHGQKPYDQSLLFHWRDFYGSKKSSATVAPANGDAEAGAGEKKLETTDIDAEKDGEVKIQQNGEMQKNGKAVKQNGAEVNMQLQSISFTKYSITVVSLPVKLALLVFAGPRSKTQATYMNYELVVYTCAIYVIWNCQLRYV